MRNTFISHETEVDYNGDILLATVMAQQAWPSVEKGLMVCKNKCGAGKVFKGRPVSESHLARWLLTN